MPKWKTSCHSLMLYQCLLNFLFLLSHSLHLVTPSFISRFILCQKNGLDLSECFFDTRTACARRLLKHIYSEIIGVSAAIGCSNSCPFASNCFLACGISSSGSCFVNSIQNVQSSFESLSRFSIPVVVCLQAK